MLVGRRRRGAALLFESLACLAAVLVVEHGGEVPELVGSVRDQEHREIGEQLGAQTRSGPRADDHAVDRAALQGLVDAVQRGLRGDDHVAGGGELRCLVELDDRGARIVAEVDIDERDGHDTAPLGDGGGSSSSTGHVVHDIDGCGPFEQRLEVAGQGRPFSLVVVDDQDHESIAHSRPTARQIGGITKTTSTSPTPPTAMPAMAMSFDEIDPEA